MYGPKGVGAALRATQAACAHYPHHRRRRPRARHALGHAECAGHRRVRQGRGAERGRDARESKRLLALRERLRLGIEARVTDTVLNGSLEHRLPGSLNMSFAYVEGEALMMALKDVAVSSGSACTSASLEPSYVCAPWACR